MDLTKFKIDLDHSTILNKCLSDSISRKLKIHTAAATGYAVLENVTHNYSDLTLHTQPHSWDEMSSLVSKIKELTSIDNVRRSWYNIMSYSGNVRQHSHPKAEKYVCVYYVEVNPTHSPIEFFINDEWIPIHPTVGECILFDKDCLHRVSKQMVHYTRCTINFEI